MVKDFYFSVGLPEILIAVVVLAILVFGGLKLAKLLWAGLLD